jgi:hypothetical protein
MDGLIFGSISDQPLGGKAIPNASPPAVQSNRQAEFGLDGTFEDGSVSSFAF